MVMMQVLQQQICNKIEATAFVVDMHTQQAIDQIIITLSEKFNYLARHYL